jgi:hypothetical protein
MSLFRRRPLYKEAATKLVGEIWTLLRFQDWTEFPPPYRPDEIEAIKREFASWNATAKTIAEREKGPGARLIVPKEDAELTNKLITAVALSACAMYCHAGKRYANAISSDLKSCLISLSPYCLLNIGRILAEMNLRDKARETYQLLIDASYRNCPEWSKESSFVAERAKEELAELALEANQ